MRGDIDRGTTCSRSFRLQTSSVWSLGDNDTSLCNDNLLGVIGVCGTDRILRTGKGISCWVSISNGSASNLLGSSCTWHGNLSGITEGDLEVLERTVSDDCARCRGV